VRGERVTWFAVAPLLLAVFEGAQSCFDAGQVGARIVEQEGPLREFLVELLIHGLSFRDAGSERHKAIIAW
jgi:hypothetical protein